MGFREMIQFFRNVELPMPGMSKVTLKMSVLFRKVDFQVECSFVVK